MIIKCSPFVLGSLGEETVRRRQSSLPTIWFEESGCTHWDKVLHKFKPFKKGVSLLITILSFPLAVNVSMVASNVPSIGSAAVGGAKRFSPSVKENYIYRSIIMSWKTKFRRNWRKWIKYIYDCTGENILKSSSFPISHWLFLCSLYNIW